MAAHLLEVTEYVNIAWHSTRADTEPMIVETHIDQEPLEITVVVEKSHPESEGFQPLLLNFILACSHREGIDSIVLCIEL